jgi:hypothetical protein
MHADPFEGPPNVALSAQIASRSSGFSAESLVIARKALSGPHVAKVTSDSAATGK